MTRFTCTVLPSTLQATLQWRRQFYGQNVLQIRRVSLSGQPGHGNDLYCPILASSKNVIYRLSVHNVREKAMQGRVLRLLQPIIQPGGHSVSHKHRQAIALHCCGLSLLMLVRKTENPICFSVKLRTIDEAVTEQLVFLRMKCFFCLFLCQF